MVVPRGKNELGLRGERVIKLLQFTLTDVEYSQIEKNPPLLMEIAEVLVGIVKLQNPDMDIDTLRGKVLEAIDSEIRDVDVQAAAKRLVEGYQQEFGFWSIGQVYEAVGKRWEAEPGPGQLKQAATLPKTHRWARSYHIAWDLRLIHRLLERWGENGLMVLECMRRYTSRSRATYGECALYPTLIIREAKLPFKFATQVHRIQDTIAELGLFRRAGIKIIGNQKVRRFMECKPGEILEHAVEHNLISDEVLEDAAIKATVQQIQAEIDAELGIGVQTEG